MDELQIEDWNLVQGKEGTVQCTKEYEPHSTLKVNYNKEESWIKVKIDSDNQVSKFKKENVYSTIETAREIIQRENDGEALMKIVKDLNFSQYN